MKTLKVFSALLSYPTEELVVARDELAAVLDREALLRKPERSAIQTLIEDLANADLMDVQERYILLFDRTRSLSLHLFEHVHGESPASCCAASNSPGAPTCSMSAFCFCCLATQSGCSRRKPSTRCS